MSIMPHDEHDDDGELGEMDVCVRALQTDRPADALPAPSVARPAD
jgi:hypothetical protein